MRFKKPGEDKEPRSVIRIRARYVRITHRQTGIIGARVYLSGRALSRKDQASPVLSFHWVGSDAARYGSDFQADYVDGPLERVRLEKCSQASSEIISFALPEAFESRTATSPGRLRATSTLLPLWLL